MALPNLELLCVPPTAGNQDLRLRFPGGAEIAIALPDAGIPDPLELVKGLVGHVNTALSPLVPVFNMIDTLIAIVEFAKAVPTLNPIQITDKLKGVTEAIGKLLALIPQLSVPIMILDFVDALLLLCTGMQRQLSAMLAQQNRLLASQARAVELGSVQLQAVVDCGNESLAIQMTAMNDGLAPINRLLALVNLIIGLVPGLPTIPTFENLGSDIQGAIDSLGETLALLQSIRNAIPL